MFYIYIFYNIFNELINITEDTDFILEIENLELNDYPNIHFVGDALSARGITVSGAQGTYVAEDLIKKEKENIINFSDI